MPINNRFPVEDVTHVFNRQQAQAVEEQNRDLGVLPVDSVPVSEIANTMTLEGAITLLSSVDSHILLSSAFALQISEWLSSYHSNRETKVAKESSEVEE